jgi:hypothetical protein
MLLGETVVCCENHTEHTGALCVGRIYSNSVRTSQEALYVSATKPNRLLLFGETVVVYCENHTEHKYIEWERCGVFKCSSKWHI